MLYFIVIQYKRFCLILDYNYFILTWFDIYDHFCVRMINRHFISLLSNKVYYYS